jgi:hypothetical protein
MVAAAIQSALVIQAQERLCSEDNREYQGLDSASLEDVARMWKKKPSRYNSHAISHQM